jgi:hypothetical protein
MTNLSTAPTAGAPTNSTLGKQRNGVTVALLSIITLGIYWLVYVFKTSSEIKRHSGVGLGGGVAFIIAFFLGFLTPFLLANDVKAAREKAGMPETITALTGFWSWIPLLGLFIFPSKLQAALNEYWVHEGAPRV